MNQPTRRTVLATLGIAAAAGCSQLSSDSSSDGTDGGALRERTVERTTETFTLGKNSFEAFPLTFEARTVLTYSVVADEDVDVIVFHQPDFQRYKKGSADQLPYVEALSEQNTSVTAAGAAVTPGEPVLVVDNTTWAATPPSEEVHVEVDIDAFVRSGANT